MVRLFTKQKYSPIGVDVSSRSVKLLQLNGDRTRLVEAVRWDLPPGLSKATRDERTRVIGEAIRSAREGRAFRGKNAVLCLNSRDLYIQNLRVPKGSPEEIQRQIFQDISGRIPFPVQEATIRFLEAADVRQGEMLRREVIVLACHQPVLDERIETLVQGGLHPLAVDTAATAMLRCYHKQFRRDEDRSARSMFVNIGASQTTVVIAEDVRALFIKCFDIGGKHLDEAVSQHLKMSLADAAALRRHNGDRRADQKDPEITRSIVEATRPVVDQLANELSLCIRYQSVTFRGQPLVRAVLGGGEASQAVIDQLAAKLSPIKLEIGEPLRTYDAAVPSGRTSQWDVATGLALREVGV